MAHVQPRLTSALTAVVLGASYPLLSAAGPIAAPPASATPSASATPATLSGRAADVAVRLGPAGTAEIRVTPLVDGSEADLTLTLSQRDRTLTTKRRQLGTVRRERPVVTSIDLGALPPGDVRLAASVLIDGVDARRVLAVRSHRGRAVSADTFGLLDEAALAADRATGLITEAERYRRLGRLHEVATSAPVVRRADAQTASTTTIVSGRLTYQARNSQYFPSREVIVDLVTDTGAHFMSDITDTDGYFSFPMTDLVEGTYRVRATSQNIYGEIKHSSGPYLAYSPWMYLRPGDTVTGVTMQVAQTDAQGPAFALMDAHYHVARFYHTIRRSSWPVQTQVNYPSGEDNSWYNKVSGDINIAGADPCGPGCEDAYDWDVIAHEFGHVVAHAAGMWSVIFPGSHSVCSPLWSGAGTTKSGSIALAWEEGWATFFGEVAQASGVPAGMPLAQPGFYQDLPAPQYSGGLEYSLEDSVYCPGYGGDDMELAVSRALWDMWDNSGDEPVAWAFTDMLNRLDSADSLTFVEALNALTPGRTAADLAAARTILQMHGFAPRLTTPSSFVGTSPAPLAWLPGGPLNHPNNQFTLRITNAGNGAVIVDRPLSATSYTPTLAEWQLMGQAGQVTVDISGQQNESPVTGPYAMPPQLVTVIDVPRLMVVGDSISHGFEGDYTWRYRLKQHLTASGQSVDFVGPYVGAHHLLATPPPAGTPTVDGRYGPDGTLVFDSEHFAVWGKQAAQAKNEISPQVSQHQPDFLLVELGFNDLAWGVSNPDGTVTSIRQLIENARAAKPDIRILVANVVHRTPLSNLPGLPAAINSYNSKLAAAIPTLTTPASPVALVDINGLYLPASDTYDGLHPNGVGEYKIAVGFANVLSAQFGLGGAFGPVPPSMPVLVPAAPTWLDAAAVPAGVQVTWQHSFGATGYNVYSRKATPPPGEGFSVTALPVAAETMTFSWVVSGQTYEYFVVPVRGSTQGPVSPTDSVEANPQTAAGPTNISVIPGSGYADLSWTRPQGAYSQTVHSYKVFYLDRSVAGSWLQAVTTTSLSLRLTGLVNGHRYTISVASVNAAGEGLPAGAPAVVPGYGRPDPPVLQSALMTSPTDTTLTWTGAPGVAGYYTKLRNWYDGAPFTTHPYMHEGTTRTVGWLFPADRYEFCIIAANGSLTSTTSSNCLRSQMPPPQLLAARIIDEQTVELTWTAVPAASKYRIYKRDVQLGTPFGLVGTFTGTSRQVGSLTLGSDRYQWYVVAVSWTEQTQSPPSNIMLSQL